MQILPMARAANLVVQNMDDEVLIYDLVTDKAFCLNETAAFVWRSCTGKQTVSVIAAQLAKRNSQPVNEDIIWMTLEQLDKDDLLSQSIQSANPLAGMSRREVIRKVGLASMIALPIITGLIAPTAAEAQSGRRTCVAAGNTSSATGGNNFECFLNVQNQCCNGTINPATAVTDSDPVLVHCSATCT